MKSLEVILMETVRPVTLNSASLLLENLVEMHRVDCINWKEFSGKPAVDFRIGHTVDHLLLKFYVREDFLRAMETEINGDVYQDSCVEFFWPSTGGTTTILSSTASARRMWRGARDDTTGSIFRQRWYGRSG